MPLVKLETAPDLVDQVYRALLDAISEGALAPGQRVTQEELAAQLSVSRQPVLQALRLLKKDGFVRDAPGRGLLVSPLDANWLSHVYEVRGVLDGLAARLAAERRVEIDPAIVARGRKAAQGRNVKAMIDADLAFHNALYEASRNPLIAQSAALHWRHIRRVMGAVLQSSSMRATVWTEHAAIEHAIAEGRAEDAERLARAHASAASRHLAANLSPAQEHRHVRQGL